MSPPGPHSLVTNAPAFISPQRKYHNGMTGLEPISLRIEKKITLAFFILNRNIRLILTFLMEMRES